MTHRAKGMTMDRTKLLVMGGFLGAGKTTALLRLAKMYHEEGQRVGLITNDQAANLVDTGIVRFHGFRVEEVAGACFCCKFGELAEAADRIRADERPDILLAEPVGSCTDLAATVIAPLRKLHADRYALAPYSVLVDPERGRQIVLEKGFGGFSSKVAYIFQKQLEEADIICINKVDRLLPPERERIFEAITGEFQKATVIAISALSGEGFKAWRALLDGKAAPQPNIVDIDYERYAEGEAELGWLNLALRVAAPAPFDPNLLVEDLLEQMRGLLAACGAEAAHIKVFFETAGSSSSMANYVGGGSLVRLSQAAKSFASEGRMTLNARVHMDPEALRAIAGEAITRVLSHRGASEALEASAHFRPGRPVPTHRYTRGEA
jgi:Ni2+-binding GTPase involved in maturation of urease and hydrogenase